MKTTSAFAILAAAAATLALGAGAADPGERSGKEVADQFCIECHDKGANGAPRVGDTKAWKKRAARGLSGLTANALAGVRKMPPHGGTLQVNDLEMKRAITYMVNKSGGKWAEPIDRRAKVTERTPDELVKSHCNRCHGTGEGGAPRIGDKDAWVQRAKSGLDSLVASAIHGHGGMPARAGLADE